MRRISLITSLSALALFVTLLGGRWSVDTAAQDATPVGEATGDGHPLVGAWLLDADDPEEPPSLATFTSDGIFTRHEPDGADGVGSWEATGETTATVTFVSQFFTDEEGTVASTTVRAEVEVAEDGDSFTATYTLEFVGEGFPEGEIGPGTADGERIAVEPMGTPVMSLEEAFAEDGAEDGMDAGDAAEGEAGVATPEA